MNKIFNFIEEKMMPVMLKVGENKYVSAVKEGMTSVIAFTIIGSVFLIIGNIPIEWWLEKVAPYSSILDAGVAVTFGVLGLLSTVSVAYNLAKNFGVDPITNTATTIVAFLLATLTEENAINTSVFDASGMFTGLVIAMFTVTIYKWFVSKDITIKMPDGVPEGVANSFTGLIPSAVVIIIIWIIHIMLGFDLNEFFRMIFSPLMKGVGTLPGFLAFAFIVNALWVVGIHGDSVLSGVTTPIFLGLLAENLGAFQSNSTIPNITPDGFWILFGCIGGSGSTLGLVFMMLRSKSKTYNSVGKASILPAIFCINEPVIFGAPIVMNPILAIPFIVTPMILATITYGLMYFGLIGKIVFAVPWTIPPVIGPYLATNGDIRAAIWGVCTIIISYLCFLPFFKIEEKRQLALEHLDSEK